MMYQGRHKNIFKSHNVLIKIYEYITQLFVKDFLKDLFWLPWLIIIAIRMSLWL